MDDLLLPLAAGCLVALVSALAVVVVRRPVYAAIALLAHSLSLAGLFAILGAGFVAVGQVIIYTGAIVVLFLIVVTLLPVGAEGVPPSANRVSTALVGGGGLLAAFAAVFASGAQIVTRPASGEGAGSVEQVGRALFGPLLVAFELTAPLLLVAIIGAVALWRRHEPESRVAPTPGRAPGRRRVVLHR